MMRSRSSTFATGILLATVLLAFSELSFAAAGKVLFVSGPVTLERGTARALNKGEALEVGDVIVTGEKARAQVLMADGATVALRAGSRFRIDEFSLPPTVNAPTQAAAVTTDGRSVASLLKGGFRTTTGAVGKVDRSAYEVRTPIGTLGIRGTDYAAVFCSGDCTDVPGMAAGVPIRDGLYLGVYDGSIRFVGGGRELPINKGEFVFIPLAGTRPEPLQSPPAFLEEDGAGRITLGSAGAARSAPSAAKLDEFNKRRAPGETPEGGEDKNRDEGNSDVTQPIIGTTPNGTPVDLTGGSLQPPRGSIAFSIGAPGPVVGFDAVSTDVSSNFARDATGNITAFTGPFEAATGAVPAAYQIATSANTDVGNDAATGLGWGRWNTGAANIVASGTTLNPDLVQQSLHWIASAPFDLEPVLPVTGTATYTLVGGTSPTDTLGGVGTLGAAFLDADFSNGAVTTTLSLDVNQINWFATGSAPLSATSNLFSADFDAVTLSGVAAGSGSFSGFFTQGAGGGQPPEGVGLSYTLFEPQGLLGTVNGVIVLAQGAGQPPPAPLGRREIGFSILQLPVGALTTRVVVDAAADYTLDAGFNLTRFGGVLPLDPDAPASYQIGTSTVAESAVDGAIVMRWGRWAGGDINITDGATTITQSLAQQSLHWIESGNTSGPPVMPTSGTATYTLVGATSPTDSLGNVGVLGNATFSADFTNQVVDSSLDLTINSTNWVVVGRGSIGAQSGLLPHQFAGAYTGTINGTIPAFGGYSGFFSQPGSTVPGVPGGAGLTYTLSDGQGVLSATGAAVFRGP